MTTLPPGIAWREPDVFNDFAPMPALEDIDPIANNFEMMMQAINMDGVCSEIGIVLVPFEHPRGLLLPVSWYLNMAGVQQALNEIHETSVSGKDYLQYTGGKVPVIKADDMILEPSPTRTPLRGVGEGIRGLPRRRTLASISCQCRLQPILLH